MTNKDYILKVSSPDRKKRIAKILSCITHKYRLQTAGDLTNIIIPAIDQKNKITVMAHHDIFPRSAGFNDNSSGVVTLLKLQDYLPDNVELVFTDKEEVGGVGCNYYLMHSTKPQQAINLDVVGLPGGLFYEEYIGHTAFTLPVPESLIYYDGVPFSDSYILRQHKVPNILILSGKSEENLIRRIFETQHCGKDDHKLSVISEETMDKVFETVIEMIGGDI